MKLISVLVFAISLIQSRAQNSDVLLGVFDGRTPCQELASQLKQSKGAECIKIKWRLHLFKDRATGEPTRYELQGLMYKREAPKVGTWRITRGIKSDPDAIVYELQDDAKPIFLLKADDNVLFFLDAEKRIMVGNSDFSYTLNRKS